jgi:hypothetical protein
MGQDQMNILLYKDETLHLDLNALSEGLSAASALGVKTGRAKFRLSGSPIRCPDSYDLLGSRLVKESEKADFSFCFTKTPYDNNYFFESNGGLIIISFYAWEQLTPLPLENGAAYFFASLLRVGLSLPPPHNDTTGCINDFLWDKTGVDLGMRSGFFCQTCKRHLAREKSDLPGGELRVSISKVLRDLGEASRNNENVVHYWNRAYRSHTVRVEDSFDVFLCYNTKDRPQVRKIAQQLEARGIRTWLDQEQLRPGTSWQDVLEEKIGTIETAAVFVGSSGIGPWQNRELNALLSEFVRRKCPVIPVILSEARRVPKLPIFLRQLQWVDFRDRPRDALDRLVWGITGKRSSGTR